MHNDDRGALVLAVTRRAYTASVVTFLDPTMRWPGSMLQIGIWLIHDRWTAASPRSTMLEE
jgi:hypothetical protein